MKKCSSCGQAIRGDLEANVFSWTVISVIIWTMFLIESEWTVAWWVERYQLVALFVGILGIAIYFWGCLLDKKQKDS